MRSLFVSAAIVLVGLSGTANAHDRGAERIVTRWYYDYLGRRPSAEEVYQWTSQLRSGLPLLDAEAGFLGSAEYCQRNGHDPYRYVVALYRDVLGRYPAPSEVESHLPGFRALRWNHQAFAREFLKSAALELQTRRVAPPPPPEEYEYYRPSPRLSVPYYRR